ncbi:MAG: PspC domain-containing protein [Dethiobacter sp.]|jgi:phage shock protein C|nr:PspC domain-containing protein [Dethiobacter sp.]
MSKKLYRSQNGKMLSGVCGGIAEYFDVDPTIVRLIWVIGSLFLGFGFGGLLAYLVCALVIPAANSGSEDI